MDIPADLLVTSTTNELLRHPPKRGGNNNEESAPVGDIDEQELNQLATHLPDMILNMNLSVDPPFVRQFSGVIMFLDISGFTDLSEKCSSGGSAGSDQLTAILNDYMGAMIDEVLKIQGDVLKFAGDAILVFWKIEDYDHLLKLVKSVIECSCTIQKKYGTWNAEGITTLRVKIALSLGRTYFFVFGRGKHYFYCESGAAVKDAKTAEHLSKSGDVIVSPYMWSYCDQKEYSFTVMEDEQHVKVHGLAVNKDMEKKTDDAGDKSLFKFPFRFSKESKNKMQMAKETTEASNEVDEAFRSAAFETGVHLNELLSKYVTDVVLDKLEAGQGIEYHSEIRSCTIAFINLELTSEDLKASKQCDILQQAYEAIAAELDIFKASLNKVVMFDKGCSFLIIFGLPGKKDSYDCKHAVQCAYKIREKLQALPDVEVASAGVTTGHVFCGVVGHDYRHEYTVIGKMVNMAARLMCHYPGMVSCDTETYTHSRLRQHHFKDVPAKELKGLTDVGVIREYTEDSSQISFLALPLHRHTRPVIARERELKVFDEKLKALIATAEADKELKQIISRMESAEEIPDQTIAKSSGHHTVNNDPKEADETHESHGSREKNAEKTGSEVKTSSDQLNRDLTSHLIDVEMNHNVPEYSALVNMKQSHKTDHSSAAAASADVGSLPLVHDDQTDDSKEEKLVGKSSQNADSNRHDQRKDFDMDPSHKADSAVVDEAIKTGKPANNISTHSVKNKPAENETGGELSFTDPDKLVKDRNETSLKKNEGSSVAANTEETEGRGPTNDLTSTEQHPAQNRDDVIIHITGPSLYSAEMLDEGDQEQINSGASKPQDIHSKGLVKTKSPACMGDVPAIRYPDQSTQQFDQNRPSHQPGNYNQNATEVKPVSGATSNISTRRKRSRQSKKSVLCELPPIQRRRQVIMPGNIDSIKSLSSEISSVRAQGTTQNILLYEGMTESGTSRLLSEIAAQGDAMDNLIIIDFNLTSNDQNRPYLVVRTILANLMELPFEEGKALKRCEVLSEMLLSEFSLEEVKAIEKCVEYPLLLSGDMEEFTISTTDDDHSDTVIQVLDSVMALALDQQNKLALIIIDDAEFMDPISWKFVHNCISGRTNVMVVMAMLNYEKALPIDYIDRFLELHTVHRHRMESIPPDDLAAVACQMINVCALPVEVEQLLIDKTQGMPGYIRHILTDLLTTHQLQIVSLLQFQSDFDDYTWPEFERITGHHTVIERKRSMLHTKNKWAFHNDLPAERDECELRICVVSPGIHFAASLYKIPNSLKGQLLIEFDQITPSEQMTLKCACVIGFVCSTQILHVLWPFPAASLNSALEMLFNKDILRCYRATRELEGRDVYNNCICEGTIGVSTCKIVSFSNQLMRDTVYSILLEEQRSEMHHKVAKFIEASICHLTDEEADELACQELPAHADDITHIFSGCKTIAPPADRPELLHPQCRPSLYTYIRMNSSVQSYIADQEAGFCSQKLIDWLEKAAAADHELSRQQLGVSDLSQLQKHEDVLKQAVNILGNKKKAKNSRNKSLGKTIRNKTLHMKQLFSKHNSVADVKKHHVASTKQNQQKSGYGRRSRAGSMNRSSRQGRRKTRAQSFSGKDMSGKRRRSTDHGSITGDQMVGNRFSLALNQLVEQHHDVQMDFLQSRRESIVLGEAVSRPIIGKAEISVDRKFALFRQTIWHWRASLNVRNTLFTLVEAGCVALQNRSLHQAYMYLKIAQTFTESIKLHINPVTGEALDDYCDSIEEFWLSHATKLTSLLALINCAMLEWTDASTLYMKSLEDLGFKLPDRRLSISFEKFKHNLKFVLETSRHCLPHILQSKTSPLQVSERTEMCRTLSSFYQSNSSKFRNIKLSQLVLDSSIKISKRLENYFESAVCYASIIDMNQKIGNFSGVQRYITKAKTLTEGDVSEEVKNNNMLADLHLQVTILHSAMCEGSVGAIRSAVESVQAVESKLSDDELLKLYTTPNIHRAMITFRSSEDKRGEILRGLESVDDMVYYSCLWEEYYHTGFKGNSILTDWMKGDMESFTQAVLDHRLENIPDEDSAQPYIDVYENNILATFVLQMLLEGKLTSAIEMQDSIVLLEALQPKELDTYWKVYTYTKVLTLCILALERTKNPNTLLELANKMLTELLEALRPVPSFSSEYKKMSHALNMWNKEKRLPNNILQGTSSQRPEGHSKGKAASNSKSGSFPTHR